MLVVKEFLPAKKSLFNKIVGDSHFELQFAGFLDAAIDVKKFIKNYIQLGFKMEYINYEGVFCTCTTEFAHLMPTVLNVQKKQMYRNYCTFFLNFIVILCTCTENGCIFWYMYKKLCTSRNT